MSDVVSRSVAEWESDEVEFQITQFYFKFPWWMKHTLDSVADKLSLSSSEFVRRSLVYQLYVELAGRSLLQLLPGESVEQAVCRFYFTSLKGAEEDVTTTDTTSGE